MLFDTAVSLVPFVTNQQFFTPKKVHQTRLISLNLLTQVSVLLRSLRSPTQNFDSPFGLPQDDTLTLELLCLFVTLSKAGCTVLSKGTHSKTPAASNFREWCKPERKAKNACIF